MGDESQPRVEAGTPGGEAAAPPVAGRPQQDPAAETSRPSLEPPTDASLEARLAVVPSGRDDAGPDFGPFAERVAKARTQHADFDSVALNPRLPISPAMAETIARAEAGPEIAYQLGRNPELAARIAELDPLDAARELGRLQAQFDPPRRNVTAAPPPLQALGGNEAPRRLPGDMSYEEYRRWRSGL